MGARIILLEDCDGALAQVELQVVYRLQPMRFVRVCGLIQIHEIAKLDLHALSRLLIARVNATRWVFASQIYDLSITLSIR